MNAGSTKDPAVAETRGGSENSPVFQVGDPINDHFSLGMRPSLVGIDVSLYEEDSLGFSYERWQQGELDAVQGRVRPFADVIDAIRARIHGHRS